MTALDGSGGFGARDAVSLISSRGPYETVSLPRRQATRPSNGLNQAARRPIDPIGDTPRSMIVRGSVTGGSH
jgi:hypothetical protein